MTTAATQLLRLLASGIQPASASAVQPGSAPASSPFADLLKQARAGTLESELPVTIAGDAQDANVTLSEDQLASLSLAADKLEAAGVRNALVTIDGQRLILDVHLRQITARAAGDNGIVAGVDGVMDLGDLRSAQPSPAIGTNLAPGPSAPCAAGLARTPANPSLLKLLAELSVR